MTNPQDNPETPPPVSPSNTSSSTPPSENPKPRFRRQKMLARKTVATGSLRITLNEKLRASQKKESPAKESDSSSESETFISASEGEERGSSDTDKNQETPCEEAESSRRGKKKKDKILAICGGVEESGTKSGGSGSGEVAEGLVHLSEQQDEPSSFVEETLADILKKVGASYDPKKRKASSLKAPIASMPAKKSKVSSPKSTVPSKGRATRSTVKQSEEELQKALEENRKKKRLVERPGGVRYDKIGGCPSCPRMEGHGPSIGWETCQEGAD
ncbi:PREDICTED: ena/VASP-like protein [Nicotiana attenuata]|uniref:ena/VASP-like protein n=1 Tax=Nicotiana attenuata TaxID=49451 RepID=UPI000904B753|nr:PREDICTED: ena/VASP-like protein [Nicotiana attenuata]